MLKVTRLEINEDRLLIRKNLFSKLDTYHSKNLVTVTAGIGFGKRTLISSYLHYNDIHYIWYTLQTPVTSLQELLPFMIKDYHTTNDNQFVTLSIQEQLKEIKNILLNESTLRWIIIEGAEYIQLENDHFSLLNTLINELPDHITCVLLGKHLPNKIMLSKWKIQGKLQSIKQEELMFNKEDIKYLFHSIYQLPLSDFEIDRTLHETEGWPAGIALYHEAVKELSPIERQHFWDKINAGDDIYHYITNEIIDELPSHLQYFLYYCSLCRSIDEDILMKIIPDITVSHAIHELQAKGVIITFKTYENPRMHKLFRRYLYKKALMELGEEEIQSFHEKVAQTYLEKYQFFDAFSHALASSNTKMTTDIMNVMVDRYEPEHFLQLIDGWLESISPTLDLSKISLFIFRCIPIKLSERLIEPLLLILKTYENSSPSVTLNIHHRLATIYFYKGDLRNAVLEYNKSLNLAKQINNRPMIALNKSMLAQMYRFMNSLEKSISFAKKALLLAEKESYEQTQMHALWTLSEVMLVKGDLQAGRRFALEAIDISIKCDDSSVIFPLCTMSKYYRKVNHLEEAFKWVDKAIKHAEKYQIEPDLGWAYTELALWYKDNKQLDKAVEYIKRADNLFQAFRYHRCIIRLHYSNILHEFNKKEEYKRILDDVKNTVKQYQYEWFSVSNELNIVEKETEKLSLKILGGFEVNYGNKPVKITRKSSRRLLYLMSVNYKRRWSKEELIGNLFPDEEEELASNHFYVALSQLRKELEPNLNKGKNSSFIKYDGSYYSFVYGNIDLDLKNLEDFIHHHSIKEEISVDKIIQFYPGDLLEEIPYEEFLYEKRNELKQQYVNMLQKLVKVWESNGNQEQINRLYEKMIQVEPYEEQFYINYIKHLIKYGYRARAQQIAKKAIHYLEDELGIPIQKDIEYLLTEKSVINK